MHGSLSTYTNKRCRCGLCKATWSEYGKAQYRSKTETIRAAHREYYEKTKPQHLARSQQRHGHRANLIAELKLTAGCADCGYDSFPEALEFDHLRDKEFTIAKKTRVSIDRLFAEILKCDVVCANCHRVRSYVRRNA